MVINSNWGSLPTSTTYRDIFPLWLSPQHLDIYIPELFLAIEYMGEQHYRPIDFFGGENGYKATIYRDRKKEIICKGVNVNLIQIKYSDDIREKIEQIKDQYM